MKKPKKLVLVLGTNYSGSTLLSAILNKHSDVFGGSELHRLRRYLSAFKQTELDFICSCILERQTICGFWNDIVKRLGNRKSVYKEIFNSTGLNTLVDSSKWYNHIPEFSEDLGRCRKYVVHLTKCPERYIASCLSHPNNKVYNLGIAIYSWWTSNRNVYTESIAYDEMYRMKYLDLAKDCSAEIGKLCDFLGISYEEDMLDFWTAENHHLIAGNDGVLVFFHEPGFNQKSKSTLKERGIYKENFRTIFIDEDGWKERITREMQDKIWNDTELRNVAKVLGFEKLDY